jgi:hypothetical protein
MGDWPTDGEEDVSLLYDAVAEASAPIAHLEKEWDSNKLEKKLREYFKKAAKNLDLTSKSWDVLVNEYADNVFGSLFAAIGDRQWLYAGQADFIFCIDAAIKDYFPRHLIVDVPQEVFERTVLAAHDRAFEEQRFCPTLWEVTTSMVQDKKGRSKVYNACEAGRKEALADADGLDDFISRWVNCTLQRLSKDTKRHPENVLPMTTATEFWHALIAGGCLPIEVVKSTGPPPPRWPVVDQAIDKAYATYAGGKKDKDSRGKGRHKGRASPGPQQQPESPPAQAPAPPQAQVQLGLSPFAHLQSVLSSMDEVQPVHPMSPISELHTTTPPSRQVAPLDQVLDLMNQLSAAEGPPNATAPPMKRHKGAKGWW